MKPTDEQLVEKSLDDNNAFAILVERYERRLLRYIKRLTCYYNHHAEDILQEVFIKIYKNLNNIDTSLSFSSWAYRIAHNESINHLRSKKRKQTDTLETNDPEQFDLIQILESDDNVSDTVSRKEQAEKVRTIIYSLPKKYRDVLILYYLEDQDYQEISDILKKPIGTVGTLLSRAKAKFKQCAYDENLITSINHE